MKVVAIVAMASNRAIGKNNQLIWHIKADLQRFKAITLGHFLITGRKNFESIGKLLPGRTTLIISRNLDYKIEGAKVFTDLKNAIKYCSNRYGQNETSKNISFEQIIQYVDKFGNRIMPMNITDNELIKDNNFQEKIFIMGGGEIYKLAFEQNLIDEIDLTYVDKDFSADTFFPEIDLKIFTKSEESIFYLDEKSNLSYKYITYKKNLS